jgi:hypothetical protein
MGGRPLSAIVLACAAALAFPGSSASDVFPPAPYDGHNPFNCALQDVGTGVDFPRPEADPFCVEFDKTQQNVTDFGIFEFLSLEPERIAAALPKCFYFQHDHWTGTIVQGEEPELWHWDGSYFFDKARGAGGVFVTNFRIGGQPVDFRPYAPPEFQPYLSPDGGGGMISSFDMPADPDCVRRVDDPLERRRIYYHRIPVGSVGASEIAPIRLQTPRGAVLHRLGPAHDRLVGTDRWDAVGGGQLRVAYGGRPSERRTRALLSTASSARRGSVNPGDRAAPAARALAGRYAFYLGADCVLEARSGTRARLFLGLRAGKVRWLALVHRASPSDAGVRSLLRSLAAG